MSFYNFYQKNKLLIWILILGFLFRIFILVLTPITPFPDEITYDRYGWQVAQSWRTGQGFDLIGQTSHIHIGYYYLVGAVYYVFGHYVILIKLLNIIFGVGGALFIYLIAKEFFQERAAKFSLLLATFWPSLAFFSTRNLKDSLIIFILVLLAFLFLKLAKNFSPFLLTVFLLTCFSLLTLRAYTLFLVLGSLVLGKIFSGIRLIGKKELALTATIILLLLGIFLFFQFLPNLEWNYFAKINLQELQRIRANTLEGETSFLKNYNISTWQGVIKTLPPAFLYVLFAPFPWQISQIRNGLFGISIAETILWYFVFLFFICGVIAALKNKNKESVGILLFIFFMSLTLAVFQGNIGTLFRQREQALALAFIFAGVGIENFLNSRSLLLKRFLDFVFSLILILLLLPVFGFIAFLIVIDNGFPIFYLSSRVGFLGKKFKMIKFRTMLVDCSKIPLFEYTPENDPRVTKAGKFLRRFSIDELPQLLNIFKGEMSFVGSRPALGFRMENASEFEKRRLLMKPGLTGWQQVNGRNSLSWHKIIEFDNWYIDNFSLLLDLKIILRTFQVVIEGKGRNASKKTTSDIAEDFYSYIKSSRNNS